MNPTGRSTNRLGYSVISKNAIDDEDLELWNSMRNNSGGVLEHRFVMAKHLRRRLTSRECVDHMDGNKANNAIGNLRLYVMGKQQPGSTIGYGTYYHEWQMALARIQDLESR